MIKKSLLAGFLALVILMPTVAWAAVFQGGDSYHLPKGQSVNGDLYLGTGSATLAGDVNGDLVAAGGTLTVNGNIRQDLWVAGGTINVSGPVGDDVHAAGGTVTISASVAGDVLVAGGQVHIVSGVTVGGDLTVAGGQVTIDGVVRGNVKSAGGKLTINGIVDGTVDAAGERITLGSTSVIRGLFAYRSAKEADIMSGAQVLGGVDYKHVPKREFKAALGVIEMLKILVILIAALIFVKVFPKHSRTVVDRGAGAFWPATLTGLIMLIVIPISSVILLATVVGIPFGIMGLVGYVGFITVSSILVGPVFGAILYRWTVKGSSYEINWKTILLGIVVLGVIQFVPFIGWLICLIVFCATLGAVGHMWRNAVWNQR